MLDLSVDRWSLQLYEAASRYVETTLHVAIVMHPWPEAAKLPAFLRHQYAFYEGEIVGKRMLWLLCQDTVAPKTLQKHVDMLHERWPGVLVTVFRHLPSYARQRLTRRGIEFVVPGTRLYLPSLGIDAQERAAATHVERDHFRPSAQALLIYLLYHVEHKGLTPGLLAAEFGYSTMTMSRAVTELETADVIEVNKKGHTRTFSLKAGPSEIWRVSQERFRSPVMRKLLLPIDSMGIINGFHAGLTALSEYSKLAAPTVPVHAAAAKEVRELKDRWSSMANSPVSALDEEDEDEEVEVWSYDPRLLSRGLFVDRLSLYLSLRDDSDERVQEALQEMMRGIGW